MLFAIRVELANVPAVQCEQNTDARQHDRPAALGRPHQGLNRGLPFRLGGFLFRQLGDVGRGVAQRDERAPIRQLDRILKHASPAARIGQRYRSVAWLLGRLI